jgi:hypothetical protein
MFIDINPYREHQVGLLELLLVGVDMVTFVVNVILRLM